MKRAQYTKYDDLDFRPSHGSVDIRGESHEWSVPVTVDVGRALEKDGLHVCWPYASCPVWAAELGLVGPWMAVSRLLSFPSRMLGKY